MSGAYNLLGMDIFNFAVTTVFWLLVYLYFDCTSVRIPKPARKEVGESGEEKFWGDSVMVTYKQLYLIPCLNT